jgi:hypothetical protein
MTADLHVVSAISARGYGEDRRCCAEDSAYYSKLTIAGVPAIAV